MLGEGLSARRALLGSGGGGEGWMAELPAPETEPSVVLPVGGFPGCSAGSLTGPGFPQGLINQKKRKRAVKGRKHQQTKEGRAR